MEVSTEIEFAQRLASNEKKQRDKAIKKLRKYIAAKSSVGFSEDDYLKIWKGLHYCMWMQDKPLIQEELSANITRLVHILKSYKQALLFIKVFFQTEAREWNGIDFWRMDKFMMFLRNMLNQSFLYLKNHKWDKPITKLFVDVVNDTLLDYTSDVIPDGIRIHLADVYLSELSKVVGDQLTAKQIVHLLTPFVTFIQHCKNLNVVHRVVSGIFYPLISQTIEHFRKQQDKESRGEKTSRDSEEDDDADSDDSDDDEGGSKLNLKFDCYLIADKLFEAGSMSECPARNRKLIYKLVKRLRDAADGVIPKYPQDIRDTKVEMKDINQAVQALQTMEWNILQSKKIKKKKADSGKGKKMASVKNSSQDDSVLLPNGKRKKKSDTETNNNKIKKLKVDDARTKLKDKTNKKVKPVQENQCEMAENINMKKRRKKKSDTKQKGDNFQALPGENIESNLSKKKGKTLKKNTDSNSGENVSKDALQDSSECINDSTVQASNKKKKTENVLKDWIISEKSVVTSTKKNKQKIVHSLQENSILEKPAVSSTKKNKKVIEDVLDDKTISGKSPLSSTKKNKKVIEDVLDDKTISGKSPLSSTKKNKKNIDDKTVPEKSAMSSTKRNKKETKYVLQDETMSEKSASSSKKKNKKNTIDKTVLEKQLASSTKKNKNEIKDVLLDKTTVSETTPSSTKMTKTKSKQKGDAVGSKSAEPSIAKNLMDEFMKPIEDGEVEIFVHSKKWKEKTKSSPMECVTVKSRRKSESAFAHFEKLSQTPPAFVRKAGAPHTLPRKRMLEMAEMAPSGFSTGKKRVSFDPSKNMSRDFKDSVNFSSDPAYLPEKSPAQGILKSPASSSKKKKKRKSLTNKSFEKIFSSSNRSSVGSEIKSTPSRKTRKMSENFSPRRPTAVDFF